MVYSVVVNKSKHEFSIGEKVNIVHDLKDSEGVWKSLLCENNKGKRGWLSPEEIKRERLV